jgi:hypothetical protein
VLPNDADKYIDYIPLVTDEQVRTQYWWNDSDRGKPKYSEKILCQCRFVHHKSHMNWPGIELVPPRW